MKTNRPEFKVVLPEGIPQETLDRAKKIRFLVLDVDGVCTDGMLFMNEHGQVSKSFHVHDGIGIKTAIYAGINVGIITGRDDPCVEARMRPLGVVEYHSGKLSKLDALKTISERQNVSFEEMAYVGDDWIDLDPLCAVGFPMAVDNAVKEVKEVAVYVTKKSGGQGAVREAVEFLLACQGQVHPASYWLHEGPK